MFYFIYYNLNFQHYQGKNCYKFVTKTLCLLHFNKHYLNIIVETHTLICYNVLKQITGGAIMAKANTRYVRDLQLNMPDDVITYVITD